MQGIVRSGSHVDMEQKEDAHYQREEMMNGTVHEPVNDSFADYGPFAGLKVTHYFKQL